jgi:hypothetical protein
MCIRVQYSSTATFAPWDAERVIITVPAGCPWLVTVGAVRAVLTQLRISQPPFGARCFCGEPVRLLPRVPEQRRSEQVITHAP